MRKKGSFLTAAAAAVAAALSCSNTALADRYVPTAEDLKTQFYLHIPFNQGPDFMVRELMRDSFYVVAKSPKNIKLKRDVKGGDVYISIDISKANKVWHVKYMATKESYHSIEEGKLRFEQLCKDTANKNYSLLKSPEFAQDKSLAQELNAGKVFSCHFLKTATEKDLKAMEEAVAREAPELMERPGFMEQLRAEHSFRLSKHGLSWSLNGNSHMAKVILDLVDYDLMDK